jgi:hypothetical protein
MAVDLFVAPTVTFRMLFVLVMLAHERRRIVRVAVTDHPTAAWTAQPLRNTFPDHEAPAYLLHDRHTVFAGVATTIAGMNIQEVRTAPRSPCQNAYVERVIGSIRPECLDHVVADEAGLRRVLSDYLACYLHSRTHLALDKSHWSSFQPKTSRSRFCPGPSRSAVCRRAHCTIYCTSETSWIARPEQRHRHDWSLPRAGRLAHSVSVRGGPAGRREGARCALTC